MLAVGGDPERAESFDAPLPLSVLTTSFTYGDVLSGVEGGMLAQVSEAVVAGACGEAAGNCPLEALAKTAALIELCDSVSVQAWDESTLVADLDEWNAGRHRDAVAHAACQQQARVLAALPPLVGVFDLSGIPEDPDPTSPFYIDRRAASYIEHVGRESRNPGGRAVERRGRVGRCGWAASGALGDGCGALVPLETYLSAYRYLRNTWLEADTVAAWEHAVRQDQMVEDMLLAQAQDDPVAALTALQQFALEKLPNDRGLLEEDPRTTEAQINFDSARYFFATQHFTPKPVQSDRFPAAVNALDVNSQELARHEGSVLARALVETQTERN